MWVLIDTSNGDALEVKSASKVYFWTFRTKKLASQFKRSTKRRKHGATLVGPFQVERCQTVKQFNGKYYALTK